MNQKDMQFQTSDSLIHQKQQVKALRHLSNLPTSGLIPQPTEWAEKDRYMPAETTDYYGQFDSNTVPQFKEILNRLHPDDPSTHIAIMKSVQSAATTTIAENAMGFFIKYQLGNIFYLWPSKGMGRIKSSSQIDPLIDNADLAKLLKPISKRGTKKDPDGVFYKEFVGGIKLLISSYNSIADQKGNTFHLIIRDEWDEAPAEIADQGDIAGVIEGRTMAARFFKILDISTSSRMETSRIYKSFIEGDQRRYFVPCPICGDPQILVLKKRGDKHGLTFNRIKDPLTKNKVLDVNSVRYICQHCHGEFFEGSKQQMLEGGDWRATWMDSDYRPKDENRKSYHAQGLISPFLPWERICNEFVKTDFGEDLLGFKNFVINFIGEPWGRVESKASWKELRDRATRHHFGEVPDGGLAIFGGVDVQGGAGRLELHLVAVGKGMEKWAIDYQIFHGDTRDVNGDAWTALSNFVYSTTYEILGVDVSINLVAVDTGYNPNEAEDRQFSEKASIVHTFVAARTDKFVAIKGTKELGKTDVVRSARVTTGPLKERYDVATWIAKEMLMMNFEKVDGPNAYHVPRFKNINGKMVPIDDEYYQQFMSEQFQEIKPGVMGWKKIRSRNEVWDTFIYAIAAMYIKNMHTMTDAHWDTYITLISE